MPLMWVRLDTTLPLNNKILTLAAAKKYQAIACYLLSLAHSGAQGSDGYITRLSLPFIQGNEKVAADLVEVGLWAKDKAGWYIPDWADYQQTQAETADIRAQKSVAGRRGNCARWHEKGCECWRQPP